MNSPTESTTHRPNRRSFLRNALGVGAGAALLPTFLNRTASAAPVAEEAAASDLAVLNFALHLEYLEAQYYTLATTGMTLEEFGLDVSGTGTQGTVTVKASPMVTFNTAIYQQAALEIAADERNHVVFLRAAITGAGYTPAAQPSIDLLNSFNALAVAAGIPGGTFDPFDSETDFLTGAFIFEDVGVTAYRGGSTKITNKSYLKAAAGILATEALHAGEIRSFLFAAGLTANAALISAARDQLDGPVSRDQPLILNGSANIAPTDDDGLVFSRNTRKVLNIVFGAKDVNQGGFFPNGVNLTL